MLNLLDPNLKLAVGDVSVALGRGRHTTRHTELIPILGGLVADTPGFSSIDFKDMKKADIRDNFIEFNEYKDDCEYKDCMHINELKCAIKDKVNDNTIKLSRYENYLSFNHEMAHIQFRKAEIETKNGNFDDAINLLKKSVYHAKQFDLLDSVSPGEYTYTAPLFNKLTFNSTEWCRTGSGTLLDDIKEMCNRKSLEALRNHKNYQAIWTE